MWLIAVCLILYASIMGFLVIKDHKKYVLHGYKRAILCPGLMRLMEKYLKIDAPRLMIPPALREIDRATRAEALTWPWVLRAYFPTERGEIAIDFPFKDQARKTAWNEDVLTNPIVVFQKGRVSIFEKERIIRRLTKALGR